MSSKSKHDIIDRINRQGRFKDWKPDPTRSFIPTPLGDGTPSAVAKAIQKPMLLDENLLSITAQVPIKVPLKVLLSRAPTQFLYDLDHFVHELISTRPDAKR